MEEVIWCERYVQRECPLRFGHFGAGSVILEGSLTDSAARFGHRALEEDGGRGGHRGQPFRKTDPRQIPPDPIPEGWSSPLALVQAVIGTLGTRTV